MSDFRIADLLNSQSYVLAKQYDTDDNGYISEDELKGHEDIWHYISTTYDTEHPDDGGDTFQGKSVISNNLERENLGEKHTNLGRFGTMSLSDLAKLAVEIDENADGELSREEIENFAVSDAEARNLNLSVRDFITIFGKLDTEDYDTLDSFIKEDTKFNAIHKAVTSGADVASVEKAGSSDSAENTQSVSGNTKNTGNPSSVSQNTNPDPNPSTEEPPDQTLGGENSDDPKIRRLQQDISTANSTYDTEVQKAEEGINGLFTDNENITEEAQKTIDTNWETIGNKQDEINTNSLAQQNNLFAIECYNGDLEHVEAKIETATGTLNSLHDNLQTYEQEENADKVAETYAKIAKVASELQQFLNKKNNLDSEIKLLEDCNARLDKTIEDCQKEINAAFDTIEKTMEECGFNKAELEEKINSYKKAIEDAREKRDNKIQDSSAKIAQREQELKQEEKEKEINDLKAENIKVQKNKDEKYEIPGELEFWTDMTDEDLRALGLDFTKDEINATARGLRFADEYFTIIPNSKPQCVRVIKQVFEDEYDHSHVYYLEELEDGTRNYISENDYNKLAENCETIKETYKRTKFAESNEDASDDTITPEKKEGLGEDASDDTIISEEEKLGDDEF